MLRIRNFVSSFKNSVCNYLNKKLVKIKLIFKVLLDKSKFYSNGVKKVISDIKKAREIRTIQSQRYFKFKTRREDKFIQEVSVETIKIIPVILMMVAIPGATLLIPIISFLFPVFLPRSLQTDQYKVN